MAEQAQDADRWVAPRTVADLLSVSVKALMHWRSRETGPPYHRMPDGTVRYRLTEVHAWMAERRVAGQRGA